MTVLIPIDRGTVRVNPNAGQTSFQVAGRVTVLEVKVFRRGDRWVRESYVGTKIEGLHIADGQLNDSCESKTAEKPEHWESSLTRTQAFDTVHSLRPEPKYLFEYENVLVTCNVCGVAFRYFDLDSDSFDDSYSDAICPRCYAWDCCEPVLEQLTDAELAELASKPSNRG